MLGARLFRRKVGLKQRLGRGIPGCFNRLVATGCSGRRRVRVKAAMGGCGFSLVAMVFAGCFGQLWVMSRWFCFFGGDVTVADRVRCPSCPVLWLLCWLSSNRLCPSFFFRFCPVKTFVNPSVPAYHNLHNPFRYGFYHPRKFLPGYTK